MSNINLSALLGPDPNDSGLRATAITELIDGLAPAGQARLLRDLLKKQIPKPGRADSVYSEGIAILDRDRNLLAYLRLVDSPSDREADADGTASPGADPSSRLPIEPG